MLYIRHSLAQMAPNADSPSARQEHSVVDIGFPDFLMSMPVGIGSHSPIYNMGDYDNYAFSGLGIYPDIPGLSPQDFDLGHLD